MRADMTEKIRGRAEGGEPLQFSSLRTAAKAGRQSLGVGSGAGFHPPASMLSDGNVWEQRRSLLVAGLREPEHFFMLRSNIRGVCCQKAVSQVLHLRCSQSSFTCSSQRRDQYMETAAKHASAPAIEKLGNCWEGKGTNKAKMAEW